ncbi:NAD(P)-binding domain-containing protein [Actinomadura luteofluorescens]|uniref:3-hydroxyisobutyrate dehydrogenase-like beta-hydroxyacid dehydrogenase n=1 Tax=Actinomadura luteofluorescens TaxID=46163 RepID=A0A7Y9EE23_9ACTN|nr:NAD(P)-binding domain-containing protein [Actinomadura luteofluorescens]NYD46065.1 3-hydroxyisobutyrate dehydrogenase-like beta-hydroxyacid dehydrogenase [Actinomadura luteofluorescens]
MTRIAFLGLGRMGVPMARRLAAAGHDLTVWNRTPSRAAPLAEAGAAVRGTPAEAARDRELVVTMLTDAAAVEAVLFGPDGAAAALPPGALVADMSTIGPAAVHRVRSRLPEGIGYVDAPVSGSLPQAEAGELVILAGAEPDDLARCAGALAVLGEVRHVGPPGSGASLKLVVNSALVGNFAVLGEALALADRLGVDPGLALDALGRTSPQARRLKEHTGGDAPRFTLALAAKDLGLALDGSPPAGVLPAVRARTDAALAAGLGGHDLVSLTDHIRRTPPMRVTLGNPGTVPAPPNPAYSHTAYVTQGPMLYVSGQIALGEDGAIDKPGDMTRQSEVIMSLLERILAAHGAGFGDVVNIRTFVTDLDRLREYGDVRRRYFTGTPPTSTTVEVSRLFHPDALLEVEIVAAVP